MGNIHVATCNGECHGETVDAEVIDPEIAAVLAVNDVPIFVNTRRAFCKDVIIQDADEMNYDELEQRNLLSNAVREDNAPLVLELFSRSAEIAEVQKALFFACGRGSCNCVREMVAIGLSVNCAETVSGFTPLHIAACGGHVDICEILLDALADVNCTAKGMTALHFAQRTGNLETQEVIEKYMSDMAADRTVEGSAKRTQVLPRVSALLSEEIMKADFVDKTESIMDDTSEVSVFSDLDEISNTEGYVIQDNLTPFDMTSEEKEEHVACAELEAQNACNTDAQRNEKGDDDDFDDNGNSTSTMIKDGNSTSTTIKEADDTTQEVEFDVGRELTAGVPSGFVEI
eukprot:TRINITY_DN103850_c0_g1_i1.p1 TRINITY_DN103850_c0_g1~~TRINITY_DN103850_c0_g1_i1.p1  ORF type:complete len:344 (-),score=63.32 TRINITY_DN103850_c0_g1_i1:96-1127(-)